MQFDSPYLRRQSSIGTLVQKRLESSYLYVSYHSSQKWQGSLGFLVELFSNIVSNWGKDKLCLNVKWTVNLWGELKAALFNIWVNKLWILTSFRLSFFSLVLFLIAQLFAQPGKLSELKVYLPKSKKVRPLCNSYFVASKHEFC